ncbi:YbgA family protein [Actinomadura kijaniata]|uniref:YbgA family protein n=1 Tax=Actinomadura kijaniata TaxID=46161 RepID=UPI003F1BCA05
MTGHRRTKDKPAPIPRPAQARPRVAVSGCLLGEPVRYNGGHSRNRFLADVLDAYVDWVSVCPEMEIGLGAPRPTLRLVERDGEVRLTTRDGSADHTDAMVALAERRAAELTGLDGWVLKSRSPSCGPRGVTRYKGEMPVDRRSQGIFAGHLTRLRPTLAVEEDGRLNDPVLRAHFVERIFAHARLRALLDGDWAPRDLVAFHSAHKLQYLAHDPERYRRAGRLVARAGTGDRAGLAAEYAALFAEAFAVRPDRGRHVNALLHLYSPMSRHLDDARRRDLTQVIDSYGRGEVPLDVPMTLLRHHARGEDITYLDAQTYFDPYPAGLVPHLR